FYSGTTLLFIKIADHFWLLWRRNQVQNSIRQSIEFGHIESWVRCTTYGYRTPLFAQRRDFRAEFFVTENAIYVFNDAYRNFLRLQRYHQQLIQQQRMQRSITKH
ncbi:MAG: hypothetical protein KC421_26545, partial [Anaerolineales bacterium]|nr:hypothetical protein [Anaerolineales bacterium]